LAQVPSASRTGTTAMQKALSLAVLLGAMLHLQGCGGGAETTAAPPVDTDTTAAPTTTATPTMAPKVYKSSLTLSGLTLDQAKAAEDEIGKGLANSMNVAESAVKITGFAAARRLDARNLATHGTEIKVMYTVTLAADATAPTAPTAEDAATAIKAAIAASDLPAELKTAATSMTVSAIETTFEEVVEGDSNSTRRLSFSFVTSDEPLIL